MTVVRMLCFAWIFDLDGEKERGEKTWYLPFEGVLFTLLRWVASVSEVLCGNHHLRRKGMVIWGSAIDHQNWQA